MKILPRSILLLFVLCAIPMAYGETPKGVAGVAITIKQNPNKRTVTDTRGAFAFEGLAPGSYTLIMRAQKSKDTKPASTTQAIIATSYSVKVDGVTRPVNRSLTSDALLTGVDVPVQLGAGATMRGQVMAGGTKKMVWIAAEIGSHMPGHWVEADSKEAAAHNSNRISGEDFRNSMQRAPDPHQEGFKGPDTMSKLSGIANPGR